MRKVRNGIIGIKNLNWKIRLLESFIVGLFLLLMTCGGTPSKSDQAFESLLKSEQVVKKELDEGSLTKGKLKGYSFELLTFRLLYPKYGDKLNEIMIRNKGYLETFTESRSDGKDQEFLSDYEFRSILPTFHALHAGILSDSGNYTKATFYVQKSIMGYTKLTKEAPDDFFLTFNRSVSYSEFPPNFQTHPKALEGFWKLAKFIEENKLEKKVPGDVQKEIYQRGLVLAQKVGLKNTNLRNIDFQVDNPENYFALKLENLKDSLK